MVSLLLIRYYEYNVIKLRKVARRHQQHVDTKRVTVYNVVMIMVAILLKLDIQEKKMFKNFEKKDLIGTENAAGPLSCNG